MAAFGARDVMCRLRPLQHDPYVWAQATDRPRAKRLVTALAHGRGVSGGITILRGDAG